MSPPPTLTELIFQIAAAIYDLMTRVRDDYDLEVRLRDRAAARLYHLFNELLLIPARINPFKLGRAFFGPAHPRATRQSGRDPAARPRTRRPPRRVTPNRGLLSARQVARRLAALLQEVDDIANAVRRPLPPELRALMQDACTEAGCDALHTPTEHDSPANEHVPEPQRNPAGITPAPASHLHL